MTALAGPVLALETSAARCAVAVLRGGDTLARLDEPMPRGQAERLMPMIAEALEAAGLVPADLAAVAVCTGPGNFTGVRIGVAAARGLALALAVPAVGVPRLDALAEAAGGGPLVAVAGALRGGLYAQVFAVGAEPRAPLESGAPEALAVRLAGAAGRVVG
ncbi:MAG: tRNA (adenosine(37)-N6)-threonylcarbamoyltransferase complex dimerization subunit type 1 TsaB, partial [Paracoccaceae bacterium]